MKRRECEGHGRRRLALALVGVLLFVRIVAGAQAQEPVNMTLNEVDSSAFPEVVAYATVSDATGHPIVALAGEAFMLTEDGKPVENFTAELLENVGEPILMTLVLDTSGSMKGQALADTQAAAAQLIFSLGPADEVAVLSFDTEVTTHLEFTTDKDAAVAAVESLTAVGGTAFNDAVYEAVTMLARRPRGRKELVILTDGDDTDSALTIEDAIDAAREASVPAYAIGFGPSIRPDVLERLVVPTGGHFYRSPSSEEIGESFEAVARLLRYQYVLRFDSSLQADDAEHTLRVAVDVEGVQADAEVYFTAERREVTVEMLALGDGDTIGGIVTLKPRIEAPGEAVQVEYLLDGSPLATVTKGEFTYEWDTTAVPLGEHVLTAHVTDSAGNEGLIDVALTVAPPVEIAFIAPLEEELEHLSGDVSVEVAITALAGVAQVEFAVDGEVVAAVESAPYRFIWDTTAVATGEHTLTATAYDVAGLSDQASLKVWVAFVGGQWAFWAALAILLLAGGVILPLAVRRRRKVVTQPATPAGPVGSPQPVPEARSERGGGPPVAWLIVEQGPETGHRWSVPLGETSLGRSRADNDIVIQSRTASRRHAVIRADAEACVYYDLETTNPTLVNDAPIVGFHELTEGDRIRIGDVILRYTTE